MPPTLPGRLPETQPARPANPVPIAPIASRRRTIDLIGGTPLPLSDELRMAFLEFLVEQVPPGVREAELLERRIGGHGWSDITEETTIEEITD